MQTELSVIEIDIEKLILSEFNPRTFFDPVEIQELSISIKSVGLLNALTVRPVLEYQGEKKDDMFEVIAGAKRYQACKLAGFTKVACNVMLLSDKEAVEVAIIENLNRADIPPLDEAEAFNKMIKLHKQTPIDLALKFGKSESYIYQRLQLNELNDEGKLFLAQGILPIGHAVNLARLSVKDQEKTLKAIIKTDGQNSYCLPFKELKSFINKNVQINLSDAPFSLSDTSLNDEMGPCISCVFRSGYSQTLFNDITGNDSCLNPTCYHKKCKVFVDKKIEKLEKKNIDYVQVSTLSWIDDKRLRDSGVLTIQDYKALSTPEDLKGCSNSKKALVVHGKGLGTEINICTNKDCLCRENDREQDERNPEDVQRFKDEFMKGFEFDIERIVLGNEFNKSSKVLHLNNKMIDALLTFVLVYGDELVFKAWHEQLNDEAKESFENTFIDKEMRCDIVEKYIPLMNDVDKLRVLVQLTFLQNLTGSDYYQKQAIIEKKQADHAMLIAESMETNMKRVEKDVNKIVSHVNELIEKGVNYELAAKCYTSGSWSDFTRYDLDEVVKLCKALSFIDEHIQGRTVKDLAVILFMHFNPEE